MNYFCPKNDSHAESEVYSRERTREKLKYEMYELMNGKPQKDGKPQKTDEKMVVASSDELVAKEVYCYMTCHQSFTIDFLSNRNVEEQSVDESSAFEKVTIYLSNLVENPEIVEFSKLTGVLES